MTGKKNQLVQDVLNPFGYQHVIIFMKNVKNFLLKTSTLFHFEKSTAKSKLGPVRYFPHPYTAPSVPEAERFLFDISLTTLAAHRSRSETVSGKSRFERKSDKRHAVCLPHSISDSLPF
ncbi:hypothetical protein CEXT_247781 [Caerostris extrusa]|uniref:Uncharacterized protein n=1 Tax=Caerostris extrusa TaxID=172846 RepID=A0AAV4MNW3_CAEEX|nr:hypothetical protein CEXT_247781 [Caerostris extrusa]